MSNKVMCSMRLQQTDANDFDTGLPLAALLLYPFLESGVTKSIDIFKATTFISPCPCDLSCILLINAQELTEKII